MEILKGAVTHHLFRGLRNRGRLDHNAKDKLDLTRLRARKGEKPRTKAGQVRQAWPDIKALFDAGHSLKDIWIWLNEIGIEIGYARLSHYTGQLRRRDQAAARAEKVSAVLTVWATGDCRWLRQKRRRGKSDPSLRAFPPLTTRSQTSGSEKTDVRVFNTTPSLT